MATSNTPTFNVHAYQGDEPFCFVSYSHTDSEIVFEELQLLGEAGFHVYYDEGIHPGHAWHDDLSSAIERCALFILYITDNSTNSPNCMRELNFALDKEKPVLAIHLQDVQLTSGLQLALGDRQAIVRSRFEVDVFRARVNSSVGEYVALVETTVDETLRPPTAHPAVPTSKTRNIIPLAVATLALLLLISGTVFYLFAERAEERLDYETALIEIDALVRKDRFAEAYMIIRELDPSQDPRRSEYAERIVVPGALNIENEGVRVSFKPYGHDDVEWLPVGVTPFSEDVLLPRGVLHFKLELTDHEAREIVAINPGPMFGNGFYIENLSGRRFDQQPVRLTRAGVVPPGMVEVMASSQPLFLSGWSRNTFGLDLIAETPRFYVSKFEVTNAEYQEFVAAGGYTNPDYWQGLTFVDGGLNLSFNEAMEKFVDKTGRPGPSTWELSSYAEGEADLPVGGVSWFEAAAYARFRGLALPTIYQWIRFAYGPMEGLYPLTPAIEKSSNFSNKGLIAAKEKMGLGPWGTYNTAGNVSEWIWNQGGGLGLAQGSNWQSYGLYSTAAPEPRFSRHETSGIRLVQNDLREPFDPAQLDPIDLVYDDPHAAREPVSDEVFEGMRFQFTAAKREPLDVQIERIQETDLWSVDEHRLKFSQEETFTVYLFKPTNVAAPYRTVLYGPPGNAARPDQTNRDAIPTQVANFSYVLKGGRAVALPIWDATYERNRTYFRDGSRDPEAILERQRRGALSWHRDAVTTINYLEALNEYSTDNLTFLGYSFGAAWFGPIVLTLESRITNAIFVSGGLINTVKIHPMADAINYLPRIRKPVLQLNGIYDHLFPWEESAKRQFELLGTPPEQKKLVGYDAGHIGFPENQLVSEIADWMDEHMGPVH